jgi:hypothetical protein
LEKNGNKSSVCQAGTPDSLSKCMDLPVIMPDSILVKSDSVSPLAASEDDSIRIDLSI